ALPVADRVLDELERAVLAEVGDGKDALEHRLQPRVLPVGGQDAHLQEALVGVLLDLDEVRDGDGRVDLREIHPVPVNVLGSRIHLSQHPSVLRPEAADIRRGTETPPSRKKGGSGKRHLFPEASTAERRRRWLTRSSSSERAT